MTSTASTFGISSVYSPEPNPRLPCEIALNRLFVDYFRMVKQFGRLRGRRMRAKIALSGRMEPPQSEADRNSRFKHHTLRNWSLSGA